MKKNIILLLFSALACALSAQDITVKQMWLSQPDSIIPYLTEQTRQQLVDSTAKGEMQEVTNLFSEDTKLTALTADYLSVNLSASSKLTMKLLPTEDNNHILCMVQTYMGPLPDSHITLYDSKWQKIAGNFVPEFTVDSFLARTDSIDDEEWHQARQLIETRLISYELSATDNSLKVSSSPILLSSEQQTLIDKLLRTRLLVWDGKRFVEKD